MSDRSHRAGSFDCSVCVTSNGSPQSFSMYAAYVDHCNSKQHRQMLGQATKIARVDDPERIRLRIALLVERQQQKRNRRNLDLSTSQVNAALDARIEAQKEIEAAQRKQRYSKKKQKRRKEQTSDSVSLPMEDVDDDEVAAVMGFGSFQQS